MNWEKAKNINIVAFFILNAILLIIRFHEPGLGTERIDSITYILNKNGISLSEGFRFITPEAKRQIELSPRSLNPHNITGFFFLNNQNINLDDNIFSNVTERMTFTPTGFLYENLGEERLLSDISATKSFAEDRLSELRLNMNLDYIRNKSNGFILAYRSYYLGEIIYSNHMIITVTDGNLYSIEFNYVPITSFFGPERALRPIDEILLNFMRLHQINRESSDKVVTILSVDIVYDLLSSEIAAPFFRIIFEYNGYEKNALINAY
ncbi:MAG: hypothetical protein FWE02_06510 [Defluviitaleaceae bacterium]|nr:hypothetical protein [Defluviitaleaceae bacterium]